MKKGENKNMSEEKSQNKSKGKSEKVYTFPKYNLSINASSPEEATAKLQKRLKGEDK
jgi:hypothetical protein